MEVVPKVSEGPKSGIFLEVVIGGKGFVTKPYRETLANSLQYARTDIIKKLDAMKENFLPLVLFIWPKEIKESRIGSKQFGHITGYYAHLFEVAGVIISEGSQWGTVDSPERKEYYTYSLKNQTINRDKAPLYWTNLPGANSNEVRRYEIGKGKVYLTDWKLYNLKK